MNVTHVIPSMHPHAGGPPVVVDRLCRRLTTHGWESRVLTTNALAPGDDRTGVDPHSVPYRLDVYPCLSGGSFAFSPSLRRGLQDAVAQSDLVHLHTLWTYPTLAAARECRRQGVPYVAMPHGMLDPHSLGRKWLKKQIYGRLLEWPSLRRASALLYTHPEERHLAEQAVPGLPEGHITPLGADDPPDANRADLAEEFLREYPHLGGRHIVLFLGRLHPKKGLDLLVPAFAEVLRSQPSAHLVLVGPGEGSYVESVRSELARQGLAGSATLAGPRAGRAKWAAVAAARVFVLPSYQENFALTVVESLRLGVPVVLSRRVNIWPEVIAAGAGLAVDLSPRSVAEGVLAMLHSPELLARSGERGRDLVARAFTWAAAAASTAAAYQSALQTSPRPVHHPNQMAS